MIDNRLLGDLLMDIYKNLKATIERDLRPFGIGMGQLQILMVYFQDIRQSHTQHEIVTVLGVDKGNISRSVMKLLAKNYLEPDPLTHRAYRLTEKGLALKSEITKIFIETNEWMTRNLEEDDISQTLATLTRISGNLERIL